MNSESLSGEAAAVEKHEWEIANAEEVVPNGWRLTFSGAKLDVPESWVFFDGDGLLVIDPGGELPVETEADRHSLRPIVGWATGLGKSPKQQALHALELAYGASIKAVLMTHGDVDHANNIPADVPVYVGEAGQARIVNPEDQFAEAKKIMESDRRTGNDSGELLLRDRMFRVAATVLNNDRAHPWSEEENTGRKNSFRERLHHWPESFTFQGGRLEIVHLPGHAPEEVGFYVPEYKILIAGDLITTSKTERADRLNLFLPDANIYQALESITTLKALDIERYYPAHGEPIEGTEKIQEFLTRVETEANAIIARTKELHEGHPELTTGQLGRLVFSGEWKRPGMNEREQETWVLSIIRDQP